MWWNLILLQSKDVESSRHCTRNFRKLNIIISATKRAQAISYSSTLFGVLPTSHISTMQYLARMTNLYQRGFVVEMICRFWRITHHLRTSVCSREISVIQHLTFTLSEATTFIAQLQHDQVMQSSRAFVITSLCVRFSGRAPLDLAISRPRQAQEAICISYQREALMK